MKIVLSNEFDELDKTSYTQSLLSHYKQLDVNVFSDDLRNDARQRSIYIGK